MHLTSNSGVNELVEFSRTGVVGVFVNGCRMLAALPRERTVASPSAPTNDAVDVVPLTANKKKRSRIKTAALTVLGVLVTIPVLAIVLGSGSKKADTGFPPLFMEIPGTLSAEEKGAPLPDEIGADPTPQATRVSAADAAQSEQSTKDEAKQIAVRYTKTAVNLRKGPSTEFAIITVVPKGVDVSVMEVKGAWSRVRINEETGWMANSTTAER